MLYCRACRFFTFGTLGPGWCDKKNKAMQKNAEACNQRISRYRKKHPKLKTRNILDWVKP